ncbi:hypothetical protein J7413_08910, partial [Shimia sp. R10_1]|uniref:hypothetical protein n=1 Tax=Shimia sp. R10_1 TaxID=2821095 RepID=UPI001ADCB5A0
LVLFQNANDLFFAETASFHRLSPQLENRLTKISGHFRGAGQSPHTPLSLGDYLGNQRVSETRAERNISKN